MPNMCGFDMKIAGPEKAVQELVYMLQQKNPYYSLGRVFSFDLDESQTENGPKGTDYIAVQGFGDCAWSVNSAMRQEFHPDRSLESETKRLGLVVEVFSSEPGFRFQEHVLIDKGDVLVDECPDYEEYLINGAPEAFIDNLLKEKDMTRDELMSKVNHNGEFCIGGVEGYCEFQDLFRYLNVQEKPPLDAVISSAHEKASSNTSISQITHDLEK